MRFKAFYLLAKYHKYCPLRSKDIRLCCFQDSICKIETIKKEQKLNYNACH